MPCAGTLNKTWPLLKRVTELFKYERLYASYLISDADLIRGAAGVVWGVLAGGEVIHAAADSVA